MNGNNWPCLLTRFRHRISSYLATPTLVDQDRNNIWEREKKSICKLGKWNLLVKRQKNLHARLYSQHFLPGKTCLTLNFGVENAVVCNWCVYIWNMNLNINPIIRISLIWFHMFDCRIKGTSYMCSKLHKAWIKLNGKMNGILGKLYSLEMHK